METADPVRKIEGKRVLVVDDEKDILETLLELLSMCRLDAASTFEQAKELLDSKYYDVAVLDIMGVRGYELLEIAKKRGRPSLILTAHALSERHLLESAKKGAAYYVPKDKINDIGMFIADVLEAREKNKNAWMRWFDRLGDFFDKKFGGTEWREKEEEFWREKTKSLHWR